MSDNHTPASNEIPQSPRVSQSIPHRPSTPVSFGVDWESSSIH
ncbi:hypothetical protein [Corynebacterium sp. ED61]|nr:hypothetical protein [Corynebacterium sp. ED61]